MDKKAHSLPSMDFPFKIQITGNDTGINWVGDFKYRRPSLGARSRIGALRARLNGDIETVDPEIEEFNHAASYLRHTLIEYPEWWQNAAFGLELYDGNVISEIYNKCMEFEANWKKKVHGGDSKQVEEGRDATVKEFESDAGGASPQ